MPQDRTAIAVHQAAGSRRRRAPVRRLSWPLLATSASVGCAFAALGVALYGHANPWLAGLLYGAFGLAAGLVCGVLDLAWRQLPSTARRDRLALAGAESGAGRLDASSTGAPGLPREKGQP